MKLTSLERLLFPSWFRDRWERVRSRGASRFIFRNGLLMGMLIFMITTPLFLVMDWASLMGSGNHSAVRGHFLTLRFVLNYFVIWVAGGVVWGFLTWFSNEALYRRSKRMG